MEKQYPLPGKNRLKILMYSVQVFFKLSFSYSGPTYLMVLSREDAVQGWRQMIGPTDPEKAKEENPESYVDMNYLP